METTSASLQSESPPRKALAEQLAFIDELKTRVASLRGPKPGRKSQAGDAPDGGEHARLQHMLVAATAKRDDIIAGIMANEELPNRIMVYQDLVLQVNAAWNDILAHDDTMRRRFPGRASIFNTAGPHERALVAPSTDRSPVPALTIDSRKLFAASRAATGRFVEMLTTDAQTRFERS